jgi:hypothetical protein
MQKRKKQEHCDSSLKNSIQAMDLDVNIAIDSNSGMNTTSESKRSITNGRGQPQLEVTPSRTGHSAGVTDLNTALDPGSSQPGVRKRRISMPPPPVPTGGSLKSARRHLAAPAVDGGPPKRRRTTSGDQSKLSSGRKTVEGFFRVEGGEQSPPLKLKSLVIKLRVSPVAADRFSQNRRSTAVSQSSETSNRDVTMQDKAGELLKSSPASKGSEGLYNETTSKADNQITTQLSSNLAFESSSSSKRAARSRSRNTYQTAPSSGPVKRHQLGSGTWEYEQFTFAQLLDTDWETPELSKDCVATYAEDGPWLKDASGSGFLRQVKSVKGGSFKETQVLLGVRFVVI